MKQLNISLAITTAGFAVAMLAAYFGLVTFFEFPDILRTGREHMLKLFLQNKEVVVPFYYLFVISQVIFVGIVLQMSHYYRDTPSMLLTVATGFGVLAGLCQAIGFLRWPFLVPYLASVISDPASSAASKEAAEVVFQSFHLFAGVAVGENLFFVLEGVWGICFGLYLVRYQHLSKALASVPIVAGVLILVYSLEQFGGAMSVLAPLNVIAHGALVFWFLALSKIFFQSNTAINHQNHVGKVATVVLWALYLVIVLPGLFE